jgi:hypothetical protein
MQILITEGKQTIIMGNGHLDEGNDFDQKNNSPFGRVKLFSSIWKVKTN